MFKYIVALIVGVLIGVFFANKCTDTPIEIVTTEIKYIKGDTLTITKDSIVPVYISIKDPIIRDPYRPDVPDSVIIEVQDSLALELARDWQLTRIYEEDVFRIDTVGVATAKLEVSQNKLQRYDFTFIPAQKIINEKTTVILPPRPEIYGLIDVTTLNSSIGVGVDFGTFGVHAKGGYDYTQQKVYYGIGTKIRFLRNR